MDKEITQILRKFISDNYLRGPRRGKFSDEDSFIKKGIIDSIGVIELTHFIQKEFRIDIEVDDIVPENFDTVNNLKRYIAGKIERGKGR